MAERITFFEFKDALDQRTMSVNKLGEYVHIDPASPILNLRGKSDDYTWWDDMHPTTSGFQALADIFEAAMA